RSLITATTGSRPQPSAWPCIATTVPMSTEPTLMSTALSSPPLRETASSLCGTIACPYWAAPTWSLSRSSTRPGRWLPPSTITNSATASGWCHLPASKDSPTLSTVGNWTTKESKGGRGSPDVAWPKASVVILNYNGRRYLDPCLDALIAQKLEGNF